MSLKSFFKICLFLLCTNILYAQKPTDEILDEFNYFGKFSVTGIGATEDYIPFWMHTNTNSALGEFTNYSTTLDLTGQYFYKKNVYIEAGAAFYYRDGTITDNFQRRDLYFRAANNWLQITAGSKKQDVLVNGLSTSNKNFLWSGDARPLPGLIIEASNPLKISNTFGVDWGIAHYELNDDRFVSDARVHYKRLGLHVNLNSKNRFYARIQHFAQWGGNSQTDGQRGEDLRTFIDVFTAKQTGSRANAEGNHLGSYLLDYFWKPHIGEFNLYHEHPIEDGSGTRLANFPDGIWGINFAPANSAIFDMFLYEYVDTTDQSGGNISGGRDSYFNNRIYKSGWYYENQNLGLPFLIVRINSRVRAHHLGIKGHYKNFEVHLKATSAKSLGTFFDSSNYNETAFYSFANTTYHTRKYGSVSLLLGYDTSDIKENVLGAGITYSIIF